MQIGNFFKHKINGSGYQVIIGNDTLIDQYCSIGDYTYIGNRCVVTKAQIGRYVSIGNDVSIGLGEHNISRVSTSHFIYEHKIDWYKELTQKDIVIKNDVWIGASSVIRRGITVGNGAVIGANSFVNHDVPSFAVVAGSPAKIIKYRFESDVIDKINNSKWWDYLLEEARKIVDSLENTIF